MIERLKRGMTVSARVFGFCYPSKVVVISDTTTGKSRMIENFQITGGAKRAYTKAEDRPDGKKANGKEAGKKNGSKKPYDEEEQDDDLKDMVDNEKGFSMLTDLKNKEDFRIAGRVETMFRGRKPADVFQLTSLAVFLPLLIITEVWQLLMIYNIPMDPVISAAAGTFFLMLTVHNARYAWGSSVQVLYATKKTSVGGADIYIPNMIEFLNFRQSKVKDLRDDLMALLNAELRPLRNENAKLNATLEKLYKASDRAKAQGKREGLTFGEGRLAVWGPYWVTILIFVVGVVLGWFLSGGAAFIPVPPNATAIAEAEKVELSLFQEIYAYLALILVVAAFLIVWVKKDNALFALSVSSAVLALTVLISPFNDYVAGGFYLKVLGDWRYYEITAMQLKAVFTATMVVGILAINGFFRKIGIMHPYGKMKGDEEA